MDEKDKPQAIPVRAVKKRYKLPQPITPLSGTGGWVPPEPKHMRMLSRPEDFPGDLWPRAVVILSRLIQMFPNQTQLSQLCEHIPTEMTPLYCEAVETGKMKAGAVLTDGSGMEELLRLLLIHNDPSHSVSGLSNQAWEILQKAKTATGGS